MRIPTQDMLVGLSSYQVPIAFEVTSEGTGASITLGTWYGHGATNQDAVEGLSMVEATLRSIYLSVDIGAAVRTARPWTHGGLALACRPSDPASRRVLSYRSTG